MNLLSARPPVTLSYGFLDGYTCKFSNGKCESGQCHDNPTAIMDRRPDASTDDAHNSNPSKRQPTRTSTPCPADNPPPRTQHGKPDQEDVKHTHDSETKTRACHTRATCHGNQGSATETHGNSRASDQDRHPRSSPGRPCYRSSKLVVPSPRNARGAGHAKACSQEARNLQVTDLICARICARDAAGRVVPGEMPTLGRDATRPLAKVRAAGGDRPRGQRRAS